MRNAIAAYNAGTARTGKSGKYLNQGYVDKVLGKYQEYKVGRA
jgi:soluble lytic murein transglycosylase-like protein